MFKMTRKRTNQLLCYATYLHIFPYSVFVSPVCIFVSPPPAELMILDVLGGECAIDESRKTPLGIPAYFGIF